MTDDNFMTTTVGLLQHVAPAYLICQHWRSWLSAES